jgi:pectate lyase
MPSPTLPPAAGAVPAFPGAQGFGALAKGGRGGKVIKVTTLADDGPGSFRAAVTATGPRIVMFDIAGTIELKSRIIVQGAERSNLTIAGQSAPGDGVQLKGYDLTIANGVRDVIIRYMRFRPGFTADNEGEKFSLMFFGTKAAPVENIVVDHCSFSWAPDDTGMWDVVRNATWQWNIFGEAMFHDYPNAKPISRGMIIGTEDGIGNEQYNISVHKNYFATNGQRNPYISGSGPYEFVNNVVYNWEAFGTQLGVRSGVLKANLIGNVYKPGPALKTDGRYPVGIDFNENQAQSVYVKDNIGPYRTSSAQAEWDIMGTGVVPAANVQRDYWRVPASPTQQRTTPWPAATVPAQAVNSNMLADLLFKDVGATRPKRDAHDAKMISDFFNLGGEIRLASKKDTVWPALRSAAPLKDTDGDGMPDTWETQYGLNPSDASDGNKDADGDGYTNIEEYLNATDPKVRDR